MKEIILEFINIILINTKFYQKNFELILKFNYFSSSILVSNLNI